MEKAYHKVLEKQIKKLLPPVVLSVEGITKFLEAISQSYTHFEKDKKLSEHAFSVTEKEYGEVMRHLQQQNEIKNCSIVKLKEAIRSLDSNAIIGLTETDDELISIIYYLEKQIERTKELEDALITAKEAAEKAARAKSDFLSVMSHEIRTPLNSIIGNIHLLREENPLPSQAVFLNSLHISADNLLSLINDILDFSKIEQGKILFSEKEMDIRTLLNNIKLANQIGAEEKGNKLKVMVDDDIPALVKGDSVRLNQILNNLVSNAVKFTHNGNITIEVLLEETTAGSVYIKFTISDTGVGIPYDKQQLIFEHFTQANSDITRQFGGSGLGLTISRQLLRLQESEIFVESEVNKGSKFFFTLGFKKSEKTITEEIPEFTSKCDLGAVKVLLVEDVVFNVLFVKKMLQNWNAKIEVAANGSIAVDKASNNHYDIILMDLQMPVMDGYTAARAIRKFNRSIPIIALTASTAEDIQQKILDTGMNDYISKPFNPKDLFTTIYKFTMRQEVQTI